MVPANTTLRPGIRSVVTLGEEKAFASFPRSRTVKTKTTTDASNNKKSGRELFACGRLPNLFGKFLRLCQLGLKSQTLYELSRRSSG